MQKLNLAKLPDILDWYGRTWVTHSFLHFSFSVACKSAKLPYLGWPAYSAQLRLGCRDEKKAWLAFFLVFPSALMLGT